MNMQTHWSQVYSTKASDDVSWYQERPSLSVELIERTGAGRDAAIIDVGAGASTLVDHLLDMSYHDLTLLDISEESLAVARARLGDHAALLHWLVGDITTITLEPQRYDVWHDRAVFHFLTDPVQQQRYIDQVKHAVKPGGHVIVATFALDGPDKCSGLSTARYDPASLHGVFGEAFDLVHSTHETHITPWGSEQHFVYCHCRKNPAGEGIHV
jgi:SAM-dependent methyltransferase